MIGIIVTGHGSFASGVLSLVKMIVGDVENLEAVDFLSTMDEKTLYTNLKSAHDKFIDIEKIIVFCDILGGSPFKLSVQNMDNRTTVIYGTNMSLVLEAIIEREHVIDFDGWIKQKIMNAQHYIGIYEYKEFSQADNTDGI